MATTDVAYTETAPNAAGVAGTPVTLVAAPTNDMRIVRAEPEKTVLVVANTDDDTALTITIKAGDYPPAIAAGLGDLTTSVPFGTTRYIGPFESGRFLQNDGSMYFTSSTTTGTVTALRVSRKA
jgi:hypothetical protein